MKFLGLDLPIGRKQTDSNTVTPIRPMYLLETAFGAVVEAFGGMWGRHLVLDNTQSLLAFSAVFACVQLIARDIGKLPLGLQLRKFANRDVWEDVENSAYSPVLRVPNRYQTPNQFLENWLTCKLIWGNTYVLLQRNQAGKVEAMYILDPQRVSPQIAPDGEIFYKINADALAGVDTITVPGSEIMHDRAVCLFHPLIGVSPLYACAASATHGRKIQTNSSKFFENMSRPSGHLSAPGKISDEDVERIKTQFEGRFSAENIGRLLVTGSDLKYTPMTMPAEQAQLIEQLEFTAEDVARSFNVPNYKIGAADIPADTVGTNQDYYNQVLQPNIAAIEALYKIGLSLSRDLRVKFDTRELLRMDDKRRFEKYELGSRAGVLAPNEAREAENYSPVEGGDTPYLQQQNFSLAALARRDAQPDPFAPKAPPAAPAPEEEDDDITEEEMLAFHADFRKELRCAA